jgi:hypothetical protein
MSPENLQQLLARIKPTADASDLKGCDFVIEAVFEDRKIKAAVTKEAEALYRKTGYFEEFTSIEGMRYYIKADLQTILPPKFPWLKPYRSLVFFLDRGINGLLGSRDKATTSKKLHYNVVCLSVLDDEVASFISAHRGNALCNRGPKELQWILDYPWMLPGDKTSAEARRYHFSSYEQSFTCEAIKVTDQRGTICAAAIITNRNGHLRIPYFFSSLPNEAIAEIITYLIREKGIKTVTVFQKELTDACQQTPVPCLYRRAQKRKFLMAKPLFTNLNPALQQAKIYDGDGDCAFT